MKVTSIALRASAIATLVSSVAASYNNESSNPHHHKPRYLAKAAKSSSEGSKGGRSSGSKAGKGSKGVSTPTIPPSFDTFDDESSSAPTSTPTSAPTSVPTGCQLTCNDDTFTVYSDFSGERAFFFGSGDDLDGGFYTGDMVANDEACGDDELVFNVDSVAGFVGNDQLFTETANPNWPTSILLVPGTLPEVQAAFFVASLFYEACVSGIAGALDLQNCCRGVLRVEVVPCAAGLPCEGEDMCENETNNIMCTCGTDGFYPESCPVIEPIEKGKSEGIGFDPRAFDLDEEEDLDFLMSMSMSMSMSM